MSDSINVGDLHAAAFVCGEFTGCADDKNGPFNQTEYLNPPEKYLTPAGVKLGVNLAHSQVAGTHSGPAPNLPGYAHQRQMETLAAARIASLMAQHHGGLLNAAGGIHNRHQSSWILSADGR